MMLGRLLSANQLNNQQKSPNSRIPSTLAADTADTICTQLQGTDQTSAFEVLSDPESAQAVANY